VGPVVEAPQGLVRELVVGKWASMKFRNAKAGRAPEAGRSRAHEVKQKVA
jgi:hypothetical protein